MNITTIRPADPERDYVRVAEIIQTFERQRVTADVIKEWDSETQAGNDLAALCRGR